MKFNKILATALGRKPKIAANKGTNVTDKKIDQLLIKDKQEILESWELPSLLGSEEEEEEEEEEEDNVGGGSENLRCTHVKDEDSWQILVSKSSASEQSHMFHEVLSFWRKKEKEESELKSKENGRFPTLLSLTRTTSIVFILFYIVKLTKTERPQQQMQTRKFAVDLFKEVILRFETIPLLLVAKRFSSSMGSRELPTQKVGSENSTNEAVVVFVLGGPGSGKGTQCPKIVEHFGFTHICAGELLQAEVESGSENGEMILKFREEGKIVPSEITMKLLQQAMQQSEKKKFLIDGFPRNEENRTAFENTMKIEPDLVLFFDCPPEVLTKRLLSRNQGRVDDNIYTIQKRLKVYFESTLPVINYYSSKGKVEKIDAQRSIDEVFEDVKGVFSKLKPKSVVGLKNECNILQIGARVSSIV